MNLLQKATIIASKINKNDGKCAACPPENRLPVQELHHIWPTSLGGPKDGPLAQLCGSCHNKIHKDALLVSRQGHPDNQTPVQYLCTKIIVQAMYADVINGENTPRNIMFKVSDIQLKKMHKRKLDLGFTNMVDYIKSLIEKDILNL